MQRQQTLVEDWQSPDPAEVINLLPESMIVCDADGCITMWNTAAEALYGWSRDQAVGRSLARLLGDRSDADDWAKDTVSNASHATTLMRRSASGRGVAVAARRTLRWDETGTLLGFVETSSRTATSDSLELTEARARHMLATMDAAVFEFDISKLLPDISRLEARFPTDLQAWLVQHPRNAAELLRGAETVAFNAGAANLFGILPNAEETPFLQHCLSEDGTAFWVHGIASALEGAPAVTGKTTLRTFAGREFNAFVTIFFPPALLAEGRILMGVIDLSPDERWQASLRESEAFFQDMFNAPSVAAWHLDASEARAMYADLKAAGVVDIRAYAEDHPEFIHDALRKLKVVDVNDTTLRLFGASHRDEVIGGSVTPYWIPGQYETALGSIAASFNNQPSFREETRMQTLDGRQIDVIFTVSASPQLRAAGQALVAIVDITERVTAQNALAGMQAEFVHSARVSLLGELTASIAHEINQPLAAITTYGETGLRWIDRPVPDMVEVRRLTVRMIEDARRAAAIIGKIRAMATPTVQPSTILSVNAVVSEAMRFLQPETRRAGATVALRLASDLPDIEGDAVQLQQVLVNLALNAFQAMEGSERRRVLVRTSAAGSDAVRIEIVDTGPGISREAIDRLFDSFFTTKEQGMGIGLPICRSIIDAHGGSIALDNVGSGGARASIILPAAGTTIA